MGHGEIWNWMFDVYSSIHRGNKDLSVLHS